jgi:chemotaxis protein methyltransferase CheR
LTETRPTDAALDTILRTFGARTGISVRPHQRERAAQGIERAMQREGITDLGEYSRMLDHDADVLDELIGELTVGETFFFREPSQFNYIRERLLPEICGRKGMRRTIRIWSAGCASGEEPYSLAILCEQEGLAGQVEILATDISPTALDKARAATYRDWSLRGDDAKKAKRYLRPDGPFHRLDDRIRRLVRFEFLNLAMDVYPSHVTGTMGLDLILCRNVLIYFDRDTIGEVARRLFDCLEPGGWLVLASGDPPIDKYAPFETVLSNLGVVYRRPLESSAAPTTCPAEQPSAGPGPPPPPTEPPSGLRSPLPGQALERPPVSVAAAESGADTLSEARSELARGRYGRAVELTTNHLDDPRACALHVNALANIDPERALRTCLQLTGRHSLSAELHYLQAALLLESNRDVEAVQSVRRVLYLDRSMTIAHFLLGSILQRRGDLDEALRAFRNAAQLCETRPAQEVVALSEGETVSQLAQAAKHHMAVIAAALEESS